MINNNKPNKQEEGFARSLLALMKRYDVKIEYDTNDVPVFHNVSSVPFLKDVTMMGTADGTIFMSIHDLYRVMYENIK